MIGLTYNRLTILSDAGINKSRRMVLCRCVCGTEKIIEARQVMNGATKSCGCFQRDMSRTWHRRNGWNSKWSNPLDSIDEDII